MRTPSIYDLSAHTLCNLPASVKRLPFEKGAARHWYVKRSRFSVIIDESPDLISAAYIASLACQRSLLMSQR